MTALYVLNADHTVSPIDDLVEWEARMAMDDTIVGYDEIPVEDGKPIAVVTAFTGMSDNGRPFRTSIHNMTMIDRLDAEHHETYAAARLAHESWVRILNDSYSSSSSAPAG